METNQKKLTEPEVLSDKPPTAISEQDRVKLIARLNENLELLRLQAEVSQLRASIKKANLEEILFAVKIDEMKNGPTKPKD